MAVKFKDFLLQYYKQMRFNEMPPEHFAKFQDYIKADDDFRGNMKDWKKNLVHDENGKWVPNDMPDPESGAWAITDNPGVDNKEWEKFFIAFQNAFRNMDANRGSFKDNNAATDFLNEHFGNPLTKTFSHGVASPETEHEIAELLNILTDNDINRQDAVKYYIKDILKSAEISQSELISGIKSGKYNTDNKFKTTLQNVAAQLSWPLRSEEILARKYNSVSLNHIVDEFEDKTVDADKLNYFKRNYRTLLNTLYNKKKIYDVFKNFDDQKITGQIEKAHENLDYDNPSSKDYLPPKRKDELTPWQNFQNQVKDTMEDYMGKYLKMRGDRLYFSPQAKLIVKALDDKAVKFKSTDGLAKLCDSGAISAIQTNLKLKSKRALDNFDWMSATLGELKSTMPKAFAGALQNGRQLNALVSEIILKAINDDKVEEAKTALEVLSVVKYGYTTSKTLDALKQADFVLFSDKNLSYNKGPAADISRAFDKALKWTTIAAGYGINAGINAWRARGSKFNGDTARVKKAHKEWEANNQAALTAAENYRTTENAYDTSKIVNQQSELANLATDPTNPISATNADAQKQRRDNLKNTYSNVERILQQKEEALQLANQQLTPVQQRYDDYKNTQRELADNRTKIQQLNQDIADLNAQIIALGPTVNPTTMVQIQTLSNALTQKNAELVTEQNKTQSIQDALNNGRAAYFADRAALPRLVANVNTATAQVNNQTAVKSGLEVQLAGLETNIAKFDNATKAIEELTAQIDKRDNAVREWNDKNKSKYKELMAYWDFLETGRMTHTGRMYDWTPGSAKAKQSRFDANKDAAFQAYLNRYSIAA